jgi:hypothetical protein
VRRGHQPTSTPRCAADKRAIFESRFAAGDPASSIADGRIVGYEWFCEQPASGGGVGLSDQIPAGCMHDAFIDPGYRNGGLWLRFKGFGRMDDRTREARDHVRRTWQRRVVADASTVRLRAERDGAGGSSLRQNVFKEDEGQNLH